VLGKVIVAALVDGRVQVIAAARWYGSLAERKPKDPKTPTPYQWNLVEAALRAELARRAEMHDRSAEPPVSNAQLIEDEDEEDLDYLPVRAPREKGDGLASLDRAEARVGKGAERTREQEARKHQRTRLLLIFGGCTAMAAFLVIPMAVDCSEQTRTQAAASGTHSPAVEAPPPPPPPIEASVEDRIGNAASLAEAIALARPEMASTSGDVARGGWLLAGYGAKLRWADVDVEPETTIGHVLKDAEAERGKRMCAAGTLRSIERRDLERRKVYVGRLEIADGDAIAFIAVGTTGELVKRSAARFCGVVIGKAAEAVSMVGMFDLPENRSPIVEQ
jgi:hypothetical protein